MNCRVRGGLRALLSLLRRLLCVQPPAAAPRLRGRMRRAVVVPAPDAMFSEAVFILRDELLREPGLSREELLREAARAAEHCTAEALPERAGPALRPAAAFLLGSAGTLFFLWTLGLL